MKIGTMTSAMSNSLQRTASSFGGNGTHVRSSPGVSTEPSSTGRVRSKKSTHASVAATLPTAAARRLAHATRRDGPRTTCRRVLHVVARGHLAALLAQAFRVGRGRAGRGDAQDRVLAVGWDRGPRGAQQAGRARAALRRAVAVAAIVGPNGADAGAAARRRRA